MLAPTLDILNSLDPTHDGIMALSLIPESAIGTELHTRGAGSFTSRYGQLDSGWKFASKFAHHGVQFPIPMVGKDHWVFAAYMMRRDPRRFYNPHIADAYHMANPPPGLENVRSALRSLILSYVDTMSQEEHLLRISRHTGLPYPSLEAFEALFYNVLDRRADMLCIAMHLYPNPGGRIVELNENYFKESPMGKMLERIGNHRKDFDLSAYLSGLDDHGYMARLASNSNSETELAKQIMGNGLLLSHTNLLNHRSPGWGRSTALLAASRQSGQAVEEPAMADIAYSFQADLDEARRISREHTVKLMQEDAGAMEAPPPAM